MIFVSRPTLGCAPLVNSELTQQEGREKRVAKRLCLTNGTGLLLACFVVSLA